MKNYVSNGETITITTAAAHSSGDLVRSNALVGVAVSDAAISTSAELAIEGVFLLPKAAGVISAGDKVDFDDSAGNVGKAITPASGDVEDFGIAMETVVSGATHIKVKLLPGVGALN